MKIIEIIMGNDMPMPRFAQWSKMYEFDNYVMYWKILLIRL